MVLDLLYIIGVDKNERKYWLVYNIYIIRHCLVCGDSTMTYKELVFTLIAKRKKYKVDTMTVSQMIGVADSSVGSWERMQKCPNAMNLLAWCNALELELGLQQLESQCPIDFEASEDVIAWTQQQDINYDREKEKFIDYYTAKNRTAKCWESMFKLWVRRSVEFRSESDRTRATYDKTSPTFVRERRERILDMSNVSSKFLERKSKDE